MSKTNAKICRNVNETSSTLKKQVYLHVDLSFENRK